MVVLIPEVSTETLAAATTTTTASAAAFISLQNYQRRPLYQHSRLSFCLTPKPKLRLFTKTFSNRTVAVRAQANKLAVDGSTNSAAAPKTKSEIPTQEKNNNESSSESSAKQLASEESISQFMSQVGDLIKLVDSRDIVELQLKQLDCEIVIRKKEAIEQTQSLAPVVMMQSPPAIASHPAAVAPPTAPLALSAPASAAPAAKPAAKSSLPAFNCPMAGTFYRSPAPGEAPFVKIGDKVQKGQIVCIIEAMKLMNEIEADQSGTVIEIVAEDGKPVSVDTPLFVIQP